MAKLSSIASDPTLENNGVWRTYPGTDIKVLVARLGNPDYERHAKSLRRHKRAQAAADGTLSEREAKDAIAPAVAKHILKGWENLQDDTGADIPYSEAEAIKLLCNDDYHDFYTWVLKVAQDSDAYRREAEAAAKGN